MRIIETIFDNCYVLEPSIREDCRGVMEVLFQKKDSEEILPGFEIVEQRIYKLPKKHTFFGIHYQKNDKPQGKLISVIQGRGVDYIVDLRPDSVSYKQYKSIELNSDMPRIMYIAPGFGHGFLSMEDNTIQVFAIDSYFENESAGVINYKDPQINLKLPVEDIIISDYDRVSICKRSSKG